ncbi:hypothetical protein [Synechococcus sp. OH20]|uniref:hypothetical protein n=1 Tax=Synechococcus sp. OH20 TaxID=139337 RepID=UPI0039C6A23E
MSAKKIKFRRNWLRALGSVGTVFFTTASLVGCQQAKDKNATSFVPGPIIPPQTPSVPTGGTEVGLPPIAPPGIPLPAPTIVIQTPVAAPTIPPIPSPAPLPTIKAETPAPFTPFPPPPTPFPVETVSVDPAEVTFDSKTTVGSIKTLTLKPSAPPANGSLVLKVESSNPQVVGVSTTAASFVTVVVPPGSTDTPKVVLTRLIPATQQGNATITVTRDPATTAANYPVGSVNVAVPVTLKQQEPPSITVDPKSITFDDKQPVGTSAKVAVSLNPVAPIGGQVVLDVSGTPNPFVPGASFAISTSTLVFKEGNKGPQEFEVVRLTPGEAAGSVTIKLNPALTTATNFLTADLSAVIPVSIKALLAIEYKDTSLKCSTNLNLKLTAPPTVTITGAVKSPLTFKAEPAPNPPFFFDTSTGVISVQCPAAANQPPIGLSFSALITVTDSSIPPISAQKFVSIKVE